MGRAIENLKQDALLPAIALISLGSGIPPRPTLSPGVPPRTTLEGHTGGTCAPFLPVLRMDDDEKRLMRAACEGAEPRSAGGVPIVRLMQ